MTKKSKGNKRSTTARNEQGRRGRPFVGTSSTTARNEPSTPASTNQEDPQPNPIPAATNLSQPEGAMAGVTSMQRRPPRKEKNDERSNVASAGGGASTSAAVSQDEDKKNAANSKKQVQPSTTPDASSAPTPTSQLVLPFILKGTLSMTSPIATVSTVTQGDNPHQAVDADEVALQERIESTREEHLSTSGRGGQPRRSGRKKSNVASALGATGTSSSVAGSGGSPTSAQDVVASGGNHAGAGADTGGTGAGAVKKDEDNAGRSVSEHDKRKAAKKNKK